MSFWIFISLILSFSLSLSPLFWCRCGLCVNRHANYYRKSSKPVKSAINGCTQNGRDCENVSRHRVESIDKQTEKKSLSRLRPIQTTMTTATNKFLFLIYAFFYIDRNVIYMYTCECGLTHIRTRTLSQYWSGRGIGKMMAGADFILSNISDKSFNAFRP